VNVIGCTIFAAISGSSPRHAGDRRMSLNECCAEVIPGISRSARSPGRHTGFLIPPSNIMIIYGVLGDVSILKLFTAGVLPGCCWRDLHGLVMLQTTLDGTLVPEAEAKLSLVLGASASLLERSCAALFLIACVLGSMYGGLATPSEAAAVGVSRRARRLDRGRCTAGDARRDHRVGGHLLDDRGDRTRRLDPRTLRRSRIPQSWPRS